MQVLEVHKKSLLSGALGNSVGREECGGRPLEGWVGLAA